MKRVMSEMKFKRCPKCSIIIEKYGACEHMTCPIVKYIFKILNNISLSRFLSLTKFVFVCVVFFSAHTNFAGYILENGITAGKKKKQMLVFIFFFAVHLVKNQKQ